MGRPRKTAAAAAETAQAAQEQWDMSQDTQGQETAAEAAQEAAESDQAAQEIIGPEDPADLLGCEDADEAELAEGLLTEYAVTSKGGLRLRESPATDAPILAVLPCGAGVFGDGEPAPDGWLYVRTGRLEGWMMAKHLEAMPLPEWPSLGSGKLPYDLE